MDYDLHYKLRRGNIKAFRELYTLDLRRLWFICCHITEDVKKAAPLLINSWKAAIDKTVNTDTPPKESFGVLVSAEILKAVSNELESDDNYETLPAPIIPKEYTVFVNGIKQLDYKDRYMYLLTTFGGLSAHAVANLTEMPLDKPRTGFRHYRQKRRILPK